MKMGMIPIFIFSCYAINMSVKYHSTNKEFLLELIQHFPASFTIKDIEDSLSEHNISISTSTIYRIFDDFLADGIVSKNLGENSTAIFHYLEPCTKKDHSYLECIKCHRVFHIDCDHISKLSRHLSKEHNFQIVNSNLTISGICADCQEQA